MKALIDALKAGTPGASDVLHDWCLEQGMPEAVASDLINGLVLGVHEDSNEVLTGGAPSRAPLSRGELPRHALSIVRHYNYFDTVPLPADVGAGSRFEFFRDLADKTEAQTNCRQPRRLTSYDEMKVRRLTASCDGPVPPGCVIRAFINRMTLHEAPLDVLVAAGHFGLPLLFDISDRDDIRVSLTCTQTLQMERNLNVRITLRGWLREPLS